MEVFHALWRRLIPLYLMMAAGWFASHRLGARKESFGRLLIYLMLPVVIFDGVLRIPLTPTRLALPFFVYIICIVTCLLTWRLTQGRFGSPLRNVLAFGAGNTNSGYFGFPAAYALYGEEGLGLAVLIALGFTLFENTLGFFITARGNFTGREALARVRRLPALYAFALALLAKAVGFAEPELLAETAQSFRATYTVLGMMLIGMGVADARLKDFDARFVSASFAAKFVLWPCLVGALVTLDRNLWHLVADPQIYRSLLLASVLPLAGNTVAIAAALGTEPEKASVAVLLSTLAGLAIVPLFGALVLSHF
jgi:predicted permease